MHIFITGGVGTGKTTLLERLVRFAGGTRYGFVTERVAGKPNNSVYIHPYGAENREYSDKNRVGFARVGWFETNEEAFENRAKELLGRIPPGSLAVMDELGYMESRAPGFCRIILDFLDRPYTVIGVIKPKDTEFLNAVRAHPNVCILKLSEDDREGAFRKGAALLKDFIKERVPDCVNIRRAELVISGEITTDGADIKF